VFTSLKVTNLFINQTPITMYNIVGQLIVRLRIWLVTVRNYFQVMYVNKSAHSNVARSIDRLNTFVNCQHDKRTVVMNQTAHKNTAPLYLMTNDR